MPITDKTYARVAMEDTDEKWELHCGKLVQKPIRTSRHSWAIRELGDILREQLDRRAYKIATENARLRISSDTYYVPDLCVLPMSLVRRVLARPDVFEVFEAPVPLVVEVWSPSTGNYDARTKLPEYQRRGDEEIWLIRSLERVVNVWRKQPDGSYAMSEHQGGTLQPVALPGVIVTLDDLFV